MSKRLNFNKVGTKGQKNLIFGVFFPRAWVKQFTPSSCGCYSVESSGYITLYSSRVVLGYLVLKYHRNINM